ncbi:SIR2 family protein [Oceanospirillum sediminis]|uniref:SIR2 family protein n=1 Tax=Oceanospirillum sediminis TaxID=2760088 RepID=A0A839INL6_9GAMM|nr:SIR2 family protein [Oceanospirillum sediminis]MBB1486481.1 SIR2 family protein [Oceanospirillum sediminis]
MSSANNPVPHALIEAFSSGQCVPVLGPGVLSGVTDKQGKNIPADSDSLILAMNNGRPMAPKLMYEFPRAAMNIELKKGRKTVTRFLDTVYRDTDWAPSEFHQQLGQLDLPYIIDMNRDTQLQQAWSNKKHLLVVGVARIGGATERYRLFQYDGTEYQAIEEQDVDTHLPVLFKPVGTPIPESLYIASDADYVDYLTELMGGFGMPAFLKQRRKGLHYLLLGLPLNRDTSRMLINDIIYDAGQPSGWSCTSAGVSNSSEAASVASKETRFLQRQGLEAIPCQPMDCLQQLQTLRAVSA